MAVASSPILVVLPYGMSFRNVVMNADLWGHLTTNHAVDVLTPLAIHDPRSLRIRRVLPYPRGGIGHLLPRRLLQAEFYLQWLRFFVELGLGAELNIIYHRWFREPRLRALFMALGGLGATTGGRALRRMLQAAPLRDGHLVRLLRDGQYELVLCTHTHETVNVLTSRAARAVGIPVACLAFGFDNLINHGPMLMQPDLLLVWGPQQKEEFIRFQCEFDFRLGAVPVEVVGNPTYDAYRSLPPTPRGRFLESLGLDGDPRVLLLTVTVDWFIPGQREIAETVVGAIQRVDANTVLLVRARPGFDGDLWTAFGQRFPRHVRIQVPAGSAFFTSPSNRTVQWEEEIQAMQEFVDAMTHVDLVITSSPSTIWLDALLFGRPTITVAYNQQLAATPTPIGTWLECQITRPFMADYVLADSPKQLEALVAEHLSGTRPLRPARAELLQQIAGVDAVSAGQRAALAIKRLVDVAAR